MPSEILRISFQLPAIAWNEMRQACRQNFSQNLVFVWRKYNWSRIGTLTIFQALLSFHFFHFLISLRSPVICTCLCKLCFGKLNELNKSSRAVVERSRNPDVADLRDFWRASAMSATMEGTFPRPLASCLICIQCYEYRMSIRVQSFNVALSRHPSLARRWFIIWLAKGSEPSLANLLSFRPYQSLSR